MTSLAARDQGSATMTAQVQVPSTGQGTYLLVRQACLVAEYLSYMAAAGYSTAPGATAERSLGAWSFLGRFPQPEAFLELPVTEQMRLPSRERGFVHYLFLRHVMPMPPAYALMAGAHLGDMARRHLERESYHEYQKAALRLGYTEAVIRRQFQSLLCLMGWGQKPLNGLSAEDIDAYVLVLQAAHQELAEQGDMIVLSKDGLPRAWRYEISGVRSVLSQMGLLPPPHATRYKHRDGHTAPLTPAQRASLARQDASSPQARLVAQYVSHLAEAGYSASPAAMNTRSLGAWSFLGHFPQPDSWLDLPLQQQVRLHPGERMFLHYLFLRHLLPMPPGYILVAGQHLGDMARRLLERESYQRYQNAALRLGYTEATVRRQFELLLCLMAWARKPITALAASDLDQFADVLAAARLSLEERGGVLSPQDAQLAQRPPRCRLKPSTDGLPRAFSGRLQAIRQVLYRLGILAPPQSQHRRSKTFAQRWQAIPEDIASTVQRYLGQLAVTLRSTSLPKEEERLRRFFAWLAQAEPQVTQVNHLLRRHIEAFKEHVRWAPTQRSHQRDRLSPTTIAGILSSLRNFFLRLAEWEWPECPSRPLIFSGDFPKRDLPLPRFLEEPEAARFLQAARSQTDLFTKVCGVTLLRTGMRKGEFMDLTRECIIRIGSANWLRVPLGKLHRDRVIPLHPEVRELLEAWSVHVGNGTPLQPHDFLFTQYGRRINSNRVNLAVQRIAADANITSRVTPHRLRHTLATMAINQGMSLERIADLLGHQSLSMTRVYARLSNHTLLKEYNTVSTRLEQLSGQAQEHATADTFCPAPSPDHPPQPHWRLLGNGYCTRPEGLPCEYETICEACPCFRSTPTLLPHLRRQLEDAQAKGHSRRADLLARVIQRLEVARSAPPDLPP